MASQFDNLEFKTNSGGFLSNGTKYWNDIQGQGEGLISKLKSNIPFTSSTPKAEPTLYEEFQQQTSLSYFQRLTVFLVFIGIGIGLIIMSTFVIITPKTFAKFYTMGSICIIIGLVILVGIKKQIENVFSSKDRFYSTLIYGFSMAATLYCALKLHSTFLTIVFVISQFLAVVWYSLSYIPFGQSLLKKTFSSVINL